MSKKVYAARLSKLCNDNIMEKIINRVEKYFQYLYIDEIQDFAGHDFNFIKSLEKCNINILYVGDYYQHSFDTSRDGNVNKNIFSSYEQYIAKLSNNILLVDDKSLIKSRRCTNTICDFIRDKIGIEIYSYENRESVIKEIKEKDKIEEIMKNDEIIKLFYRNSNKYIGHTDNWGDCKGKTYNDICVILNDKTYKLFQNNRLNELASISKNKFYVACTRTRNNLFFISEKEVGKYKK